MGIALEERKVDSDKLNAVIGRVVADFGATISAGLAVIGDKLGLYSRQRADGEPITPENWPRGRERTCATLRPGS